MPFLAMTPRSYACFTLRISVTVSATSTSALGASRPVRTTLTLAGRSRMTRTTSSMSIQPQLIGYVISSRTTRRCSPAPMSCAACAHASRATASSSLRSSESHVKPSPIAHHSTPSCTATFSSPTRHLPDFRNCTTATRQSRAIARITMPNAAVDFPLPSPVFTITSDGAGFMPSGTGSSIGGCSSFIVLVLFQPVWDHDGALGTGQHRHAGAEVLSEVLLGEDRGRAPSLDHATAVEQHELVGIQPCEREV